MLTILQVNTSDIGGGAERIAWDLHHACRQRGHAAWLAVGRKGTSDPHVLTFPEAPERNVWTRAWRAASRAWGALEERGFPGAYHLKRACFWAGRPGRAVEHWQGREDFDFPATWRLLESVTPRPDVVQLHNLHGDYFDLRALPVLTRQVPVVLTLHDMWLFTGHCASPGPCARWQTGCGRCPDLTLYPAVHRDATDLNWQRKKELYAGCRLYVATPSQWLRARLEQSSLWPAVREARVIPNGVDLKVFRPGEQKAARAQLGLPQEARVLLFSAGSAQALMLKGYATLRAALAQLPARGPAPLLLVVLGSGAGEERLGSIVVRHVPFEADAARVAAWYRASDLFLLPSRQESFGLTLLESRACGTPVVATAVGGLPEQVRALAGVPGGWPDAPPLAAEEATGVLVPPGDAPALAAAVAFLLDPARGDLLVRLGAQGAADAAQRFGLEKMADEYLRWYEQILKQGGDSEGRPVKGAPKDEG